MSDYTTALARIVKDRDALSLVCLPAERKEGEAQAVQHEINHLDGICI